MQLVNTEELDFIKISSHGSRWHYAVKVIFTTINISPHQNKKSNVDFRVSYINFIQNVFMMKWTQGFFILIWRFGKPLDSIKMTNDDDYFFSHATCIIE